MKIIVQWRTWNWTIIFTFGLKYFTLNKIIVGKGIKMGLVPKLVLFHIDWWKLASGETYLKLWRKWIWLKMWGASRPFIQLVDDVEFLVGSYNGFFFNQFFCTIIVNMLKIMHGWFNNQFAPIKLICDNVFNTIYIF
jgi:hypothetical protein